MYHKIFRWFAGLFFALALSLSGFTPALAAPPTNDNFANAEAIPALPFSATVDNTDATAEPDEPVGCGAVFKSVWYSFTPSENVVAQVDMFGSTVGANTVKTYLASGPGITDLTFLACTGSGGSTHLQFEAGKTYYLQVDSFGQGGVLQINLEQITPPANDSFTNAETIPSLPFSATADNTNASMEFGEPQNCGALGRSLWYALAPTDVMTLRVDMSGTPVGGVVGIYAASGPGISDLISLGCAFSGSSFNFQVEAGKTYYLRVDSFSQAGSLQINLQQITPPANDNFANAESITSLPFNATVDNTNATSEPGEISKCAFLNRTVWYSFTPTESIAVRVDTAGTAIAGIVGVYLASGPTISDLTFLTCAGFSATNFQVEAGKTYYLQVDGDIGQVGILQVNVAQIFPPANDNFANAEAITSLPFSATVDNTDASLEPGEPQGCGFAFRSVWYVFSPTEDMAVRLDMVGSGSGNVDIYIASGSSFADLTSLTCAFSGGSTNFQVKAGKIYYLRVDSFGQVGSLQIDLQQITPPGNDNFANAEVIPSLPFSTTADNTNATAEPGEPQICSSPNRTVWYAFTPTQTMAVRVDMVGSAVSGNVNIFLASGPSLSDLTSLTCASGNSSSNFNVEAGKTYYLQVDSSGQAGSLQINLQQITTPANDNIANAEAITSLPFSATVDNTDASLEPGEPQGCGFPFRSLWYAFIPTENTEVRMNMFGSTAPGNVSIYLASGSSFSNLTFLSCITAFSPTTLQVEAGKTYYLRVDSFGQAGAIQINLEQLTPPANDNFANAEAIASLPFSATVDNTDATTEPGEPQGCSSQLRSVWYSFTPIENMTVRADMAGSAGFGNVDIYLSSGFGISDLTFLTCASNNSFGDFNVEAGKTYYLRVAGDAVGTGILHINLEQMFPPANDNFANTEAISSLPFSATADTTFATLEGDEPTPSCGVGTTDRTIWYAFTSATSGSVSATIPTFAFTPVFAAYSGNSLTGLTEMGCAFDGNMLTFHVDAGTTYYFQVGNLYPWEQGGSIQFHLDIAPQPVSGFGFSVLDPSVFDNIQFCDTSFDPGEVSFQSLSWDFGDGATSLENCAFHQYAKDGDYTVQHSVTTVDGRTASSSQVLHVRTHDISVSKVLAPKSAKVGQTKTITVSLRNTHYSEIVLIELYRSIPGGFELISSSTQIVPVRKGNRTTQVTFQYTFTQQDAQIGKVTFKAIVTLEGSNDAFPADNEAISLPPTVVKR
jgi:PKD domain.